MDSGFDELGKGSEALRAVHRDGFPRGVVAPIAVNPEREPSERWRGIAAFHFGHSPESLQQGDHAAALLVEGVCGNAGGHLISSEGAMVIAFFRMRFASIDPGRALETGRSINRDIEKRLTASYAKLHTSGRLGVLPG